MNKKTFLFIPLILCGMLSLMGMSKADADFQQEKAHTIAEHAREMGLTDDNPIIQEAMRLWWEAEELREPEPVVNKVDRDIVATVVYNEAGFGCSERHMELVAQVVVNRVNSPRFPNTVYDVVVAPRQYHPAYANPNSYYGQRARKSDKWALCQEVATRALLGQVECPSNVFWQANFRQGRGVYEIHRTSYSTTYFCYS